ncbi:MAG: hypothetical protein JXA87_08165, partial [Thermoleophilia bacterium]|nr:hypothetical protein [Thermoleophilia bacterium]
MTRGSIQLRSADPSAGRRGRRDDQAGRLTGETTADYSTTSSYNPAGMLLTKLDDDGKETELTYDYFGRLNGTAQSIPGDLDPVTISNVIVLYDSLGRPLESIDTVRNLSHGFTYPKDGDTVLETTDTAGIGTDNLDRVSTLLTIGPDGLEVSRGTDIDPVDPENPVPDFTRTVNARDNAKRVTEATIDTDLDQSPDIYAQYAYAAAGRLTHQWGSTGTEGSGYLASASTTQAYSYSGTSGLKTTEDLHLQNVGTGQQVAGPIVSSYSYTDSGRLSSAAIDVTADGQSNPVTQTYTFDAAGNLTQVVQSGGPTTTLAY